MSPLRTYPPMPRRSEKAKAEEAAFKAVYGVVDARSEGRCECDFLPSPHDGWTRCRHRAADHHHLYKPRRSHHDPALIVHLCRHHHDRCAWPFKRGRLVIRLLGGRHTFAIQFAADKFAARRATAP